MSNLNYHVQEGIAMYSDVFKGVEYYFFIFIVVLIILGYVLGKVF